jgi:hypothetical protein
LKLEKEINEKLAQGKETISSLKSSSGALQDSYDILQKTHKDLEVQFDVLWASTSKPTSTPKTTKASTKDAIILILMLFVLKGNIQMLSKFL